MKISTNNKIKQSIIGAVLGIIVVCLLMFHTTLIAVATIKLCDIPLWVCAVVVWLYHLSQKMDI